MTRALFAMFVHGVGEQPRDFSDDARDSLRKACGERDTGLVSTAVHWAPLADRHEKAYLAAVERKGSAGRPLQRLVVGTLADALAYAKNPHLQAEIFALLDKRVYQFEAVPLTIFAHSLGGLIVTDWLRARSHIKRVKLVTFGCNIGLFTLGQKFQPVPQLSTRGSWLNLYDRQDMLGYPLAVEPALFHVRDVRVNVGSWLTRWNGLSHVGYWDDRKLWRETIPDLISDGV